MQTRSTNRSKLIRPSEGNVPVLASLAPASSVSIRSARRDPWSRVQLAFICVYLRLNLLSVFRLAKEFVSIRVNSWLQFFSFASIRVVPLPSSVSGHGSKSVSIRVNPWLKLRSAYTLVELLIVIAIIGVLAALLLPVLKSAVQRAKIAKAKTEMAAIATAIKSYESTYGRFPMSDTAAQSLTPDGGAKPACPDFTFGTVDLNPATGATYLLTNRFGAALPPIANTGNTGGAKPGYQNSNAEIMGILFDWTVYRDQNPTVNVNHSKNPQHKVFLEADQVSETVAYAGTAAADPGVGIDGVYRDPWGNPFIITLDMNGDNKCRDAFYRGARVASQNGATGYAGLFNYVDTTGRSDDFEANTTVMVWSLGPDGLADNGVTATVGSNRDNILSWQ
jgi:prepilin-type N-terminal cleavage/methylation domain-containing protein